MAVGYRELHRTGRIGWLRPAVLGVNDGIVSTASLLLGVAAAHSTHSGILVAGVAGLAAGAMSMAAGEYVSCIGDGLGRSRSLHGKGTAADSRAWQGRADAVDAELRAGARVRYRAWP